MNNVKKIGIYNNKGGVAKTTSVINLAYSFAKKGKRVLVVDCDYQENCFSFFFSNQSTKGVFDTEYDGIMHTTWDKYTSLDVDTCINEFDYVIFDLPPALSEEVKRIIKHLDAVYVPTMLGEFEIQGLKKVTDEINRQGTKLGGIFVTMFQPKNDKELIEEFRKVLQNRLMNAVIPYSTTVRESQKAGLPIEAYFIERNVPQIGTSWKIVNAYESLAEEILREVEA
ncbi:MAG: ParA family protein [Ruminococcus sp.]|nr:ParA family protein [Ruminococcus sp.]MBR6982769.1 ParA family protein [Ruminococcus sp.]